MVSLQATVKRFYYPAEYNYFYTFLSHYLETAKIPNFQEVKFH